MSEMSDIYQEVILDHNKRPRNFGKLEGADHRAEGYNPLCGDRVTIYLRCAGDDVKDVRFEGSGCAISTASASLMTEAVKGMKRAEIEALHERFHRLVTEGPGPTDADGPALGKLEAFSGVSEYPARVKCASLCWHTLTAALADESQPVTTE